MAREREVFTILETADGAGLSLKAKREAVAVADVDHVPSVVAKKGSDYVLIPVQVKGSAEGDAVPVLAAIDGSGNVAPLVVDADGRLLVSKDIPGTVIDGHAVQIATVGTPVDVVTLTLTIDKNYDQPEVLASSTMSTYWQIVQIADAVTTVLASFITGAGQFSFKDIFEHMTFTAGASGTQSLKLVGTQLTGKVTDMNGYLAVVEKA